MRIGSRTAKPVKEKPTDKIDGAITNVMGFLDDE